MVHGWTGPSRVLKLCLKDWHQQHSKNLDGKISAVKLRLSSLDTKGEEDELMEEEVEELHELSVRLHSLSRVQTSMNWQKARMAWLFGVVCKQNVGGGSCFVPACDVG